MTFEEALKLIDLVYSIDCSIHDCQKCKRIHGELKWCPKTYADDIANAISVYNHTIPVMRSIVGVMS